MTNLKNFTTVPNVLFSYPYCEGVVNELMSLRDKEGLIKELQLDSGAYTVKDGKLSQNDKDSENYLDEYTQYCKLFGDEFDQYYSLDDDFKDPEHNYNYFERMLEQLGGTKKKPVPVLHAEKEALLEEFKRYIGHDCKVVAIGSNVTSIPDDVMEKFQGMRKEHSIAIHQFGTIEYKRLDVIKKLRPDTCDSSKFIHTAKYGCILFLNHDVIDPDTKLPSLDKIYLGAMEALPGGTISFDNYKKRHKSFREFLKELKLDQGKFLEDVNLQQAFNLHAICEAEKVLNEKVYSQF